MTFSIRALIQDLVAPESRLVCSAKLWRHGLEGLRRCGEGRRESGAFLLGRQQGRRRIVNRFILYNDLDPHCLDTGIVVFDGAGYGPLWRLCRETGLEVVGDIHTHPDGIARQSGADRANPMVAIPGHIALIVPKFAERPFGPRELGIYEYGGAHRWHCHSGPAAAKFFYIGMWG